jgi:hypothetical protein
MTYSPLADCNDQTGRTIGKTAMAAFAYTDQTPGTNSIGQRRPAPPASKVRFANGVGLNLKQTDLQEDRIAAQGQNLDGIYQHQ